MVTQIKSFVLAAAFACLALSAHAECLDYASTPQTLRSLESKAGRGALPKEQISCLELSYSSADSITTKDKISRVLLINAYAYNTRDWARLVDRHLDEIDQSDPAITYLYTFYLHNRKAPDFQDVIKWSQVALERRAEWKGKTYTNRTFQLMKVRALAATALWDQHSRKNERQQADEMRLDAKTYSREWLDFARSAGWDIAEAGRLCASAASKEACGILE